MHNCDSETASIPLGWHWLVDLSECESMPTTPLQLDAVLSAAALMSGATIVQKCFHEFSPHGLSGVIVIAESHIAIHTWPEHRAIAIDFFSCSMKLNVDLAIDHLSKSFGAGAVHVRQLDRSIRPNSR